jgi:hypothetical protein
MDSAAFFWNEVHMIGSCLLSVRVTGATVSSSAATLVAAIGFCFDFYEWGEAVI